MTSTRSAVRPAPTGTTDPMRRYLDEIGRHPLLGRSEEMRLARAAAAGDRAARERLVVSNLRLVVSIARPHFHRGVDPLDLVQEGNLGLMTAAERFEPRAGVRFATYAAWWIRSSISRAISAEAGPVRLPDRLLSAIAAVRASERELEQRLRRAPTRAEIAAEAGLTEEAVGLAQRAARPAASLDEPIGDGDLTLEDLIEDTRSGDHLAAVIDDDSLVALESALEALDERPRTVVELRFGLSGDDPRTLTDVAGRLCISRERVRQLETRTLRELARHPGLREERLAA